jgi:multidrug efflux pump subunit AcrA (membrane-fusion protein)
MTADVDIVTARAEDALLVPNRAITSDRSAGRSYVTRMVGADVTEEVEVEVGLRDEHFTQILSGLEEDDVVVLPEIEAATDALGFPMMPGAGMMGGGFGGGGR